MYDVLILYYLMSTNKSIFYTLYNKGIIANLYKLYFLSSHFSHQPNKRVFHPLTFLTLHASTHKGKLRVCLIIVFSIIFCFKKHFFFIFDTKKLV